jgi:hypothetical protein
MLEGEVPGRFALKFLNTSLAFMASYFEVGNLARGC